MSETGSDAQVAWYVYMILTSKNAYYTGITTDVERRFQEHKDCFNRTGNKGAKYFRTVEPIKVSYQELCDDRSAASRREYAIKKLSHRQKKQLAKD